MQNTEYKIQNTEYTLQFVCKEVGCSRITAKRKAIRSFASLRDGAMAEKSVERRGMQKSCEHGCTWLPRRFCFYHLKHRHPDERSEEGSVSDLLIGGLAVGQLAISYSQH